MSQLGSILCGQILLFVLRLHLSESLESPLEVATVSAVGKLLCTHFSEILSPSAGEVVSPNYFELRLRCRRECGVQGARIQLFLNEQVCLPRALPVSLDRSPRSVMLPSRNCAVPPEPSCGAFLSGE